MSDINTKCVHCFAENTIQGNATGNSIQGPAVDQSLVGACIKSADNRDLINKNNIESTHVPSVDLASREVKVSVIGTGYVGLVSGVCFADLGFKVVCIDNNTQKIDLLNSGVVPIYEPGLEALMKKNTEAKRLSFSADINQIADADVIFVAVGTPSKENGGADLSYIYQAAEDVARHMKKDAVLVIKSTVPVGTSKAVKSFLYKKGLTVDLASNPEFLKEGSAVKDFMFPDRIVLGTETQKAKEILNSLCSAFCTNCENIKQTSIVFTSIATAELSKYASNAFLATKITFINEIANLCEICGADIDQVANVMGLDKRIGEQFLKVGPGYGGSCFPKDTLALAYVADKIGVDMSIVKQVIKSNTDRRIKMAEKVISECGGSVNGKTISILGATFKANTDDMRDSPSIEIVNYLIEHGAKIKMYDPSFSKQAHEVFPNVEWTNNAYDNCSGADAVVIITEWPEFKKLSFNELGKVVNTTLLIDLRNMFDIPTTDFAGFRYVSIGRKN